MVLDKKDINANFKDMFDVLQKHILEGEKSHSRSNTLFLKFSAHSAKIVDSKLKDCLDVFKNAQKAINYGKVPVNDRVMYAELVQGAAHNIGETYGIMKSAWNLYNEAIFTKNNKEDLKEVNNIIDKAKISKQNAIRIIEEIRELHKKYGIK